MSNLATGATELMLAMQTPTPKGYWGVPVLVWGMPGTGKSTFIESLQRDGFPVYTMIASLHDPTDFNGLPAAQRAHAFRPAPNGSTCSRNTGRASCFWTS